MQNIFGWLWSCKIWNNIKKHLLGGWDNLLVFWFVCHFNWNYSQNNRNTGESNFGCHRDISSVAARLLLTSLVSFNTFSPVIIYHEKSHLILTEWILCSKHGNLYNVTCAVLKRHSKCLFLFWTTHPARVIRFHSQFWKSSSPRLFLKNPGTFGRFWWSIDALQGHSLVDPLLWGFHK